MRKTLHCIFLLFIAMSGFSAHLEAGTAQSERVLFMWWNVENLFDTLNDPVTRDEEFTPSGSMNWTEKKLALKQMRIRYLLSAIEAHPKYAKYPDILAFAEVENRTVFLNTLQGLKGVSYSVIYHDTADPRGIDIGLAFNPGTITASGSKAYSLKSQGLLTRKIVVAGFSAKGHPFHVILNHWPSRAFDSAWSEQKRLLAASVARHIIDSLQVRTPGADIIVMGDFNDEPQNRSLSEVLGSSFNRQKAKAGANRLLYNCWSGYSGIGSYFFHNHWQRIDQILLSRGMLDNKGLTFREGDFSCFHLSRMMDPSGKKPWPTYEKRLYRGGYSDHLPLLLKARITK